MIDPANFPVVPVAPKRLLLIGMGMGAGLALGLLLAGIFEIPKLLTIQTSEDAAHYTSLPVLISVPELLTPKEVIRSPAPPPNVAGDCGGDHDRRDPCSLVLVEGNAPLRALCDLRESSRLLCPEACYFRTTGGLKECTQNFTD